MWERVKEEPAAVAGLVQAVLALLIAFGLNLTDGQVAAILGVTAAVLAFVVRGKVVPQRKL